MLRVVLCAMLCVVVRCGLCRLLFRLVFRMMCDMQVCWLCCGVLCCGVLRCDVRRVVCYGV